MKKKCYQHGLLFLLSLFSVLPIQSLRAQEKFTNPLIFGNNRITLITPTLFRLEYAEHGAFVDDPSLFAYQRDSLLQDFTVTRKEDHRYVIQTSAVTLYYQQDGFPFGLWNFEARFNLNGKSSKFTVRNQHKNNLGGAISTLDRVDHEVPLQDGLLSRDGWYIINDFGTDLLEDGWLKRRPSSQLQDMYCFVYGNDYRTALSDLGVISGHVPMTRKRVHGIWYCRWWNYTADDYLQIVKGYRDHQYPLDNMVFDMGWHTNSATCGTGHSNNRSWTGYTWNKDLIPNPSQLLQTLKADSLGVCLNDHPHDGIRPHEKMYPEFIKKLGYTSDAPTPVFNAGNRKYMENFLQCAHADSWKYGIDFWWLDWQQDYLYPRVPGFESTHLQWLNELYYRESQRDNRRGANYSRWAGWGDQRHPIQFSGDAVANWNVLAFEVKLTATSGNAGCYYWAHDIGGFYGGTDPELYARWTQFGAVSAALRVHSNRDKNLDRRPWLWGDHVQSSLQQSYQLRAQLMPYIYSSVWQTHCTMVPLNRSMYIDYGDQEAAYHQPQEFMFGDLLLAAPITQAGKGADQLAAQKVWFPGQQTIWYDYFDHTPYVGNKEGKVEKDINSFPLFVKGGCLLPLQPVSMRPASAALTTLILRAYPTPTDENNRFVLYEDDGESLDYQKGAYMTTDLVYQSKLNEVTISILPSRGSYQGQPQTRSYQIELPVITSLKSLKVNGKKAKAVYDAERRMYVIPVSPRKIHDKVVVTYQVL